MKKYRHWAHWQKIFLFKTICYKELSKYLIRKYFCHIGIGSTLGSCNDSAWLACSSIFVGEDGCVWWIRFLELHVKHALKHVTMPGKQITWQISRRSLQTWSMFYSHGWTVCNEAVRGDIIWFVFVNSGTPSNGEKIKENQCQNEVHDASFNQASKAYSHHQVALETQRHWWSIAKLIDYS